MVEGEVESRIGRNKEINIFWLSGKIFNFCGRYSRVNFPLEWE